MKEGDKDRWLEIEPLGSGGQGVVHRVLDLEQVPLTNAAYQIYRTTLLRDLQPNDPKFTTVLDDLRAGLRTMKNADDPAFHGARKQLGEGLRHSDGAKAMERFRREVDVYQRELHPNVVRLLDSNVVGGWLVMEFHPRRSLEKNQDLFRNRGLDALLWFRKLVEAVGALHGAGMVHRDIKPANIFVSNDDRLILGDAGIVYFADAGHTRLTDTLENVGSRDWQAPWDNGLRVEDVSPKSDIFSLGKVLWSMVSGRPKLNLWYHRRPANDIEKLFSPHPSLAVVNRVLDLIVVEFADRMSVDSAARLLEILDTEIDILERGVQLVDPEAERRCEVCGRGTYVEIDQSYVGLERKTGMKACFCDHCGHVQLFYGATGSSPLAAWRRPTQGT